MQTDWANYIGPDGRIHGTFNQTITATGRISSTEPNLQNIPVRMELGRLIRKVFVLRKAMYLLMRIIRQIELRILAHCSGDAHLIQAYREAQDIHRMTASQVFKTPFERCRSCRDEMQGSQLWNCLRDQFVWIESGLEYHEKRSVSVY